MNSEVSCILEKFRFKNGFIYFHTRNMIKEAEELRRFLEPSSEFHSQRDHPSLRKAALAVKQLVSKVPSGVAHLWQEDLQLGLKGIVAMVQRNKNRPQLNTEDLDM